MGSPGCRTGTPQRGASGCAELPLWILRDGLGVWTSGELYCSTAEGLHQSSTCGIQWLCGHLAVWGVEKGGHVCGFVRTHVWKWRWLWKGWSTSVSRFHSESTLRCRLHGNLGRNPLFRGMSLAEWLVKCKLINYFLPLLASNLQSSLRRRGFQLTILSPRYLETVSVSIHT